MQSNQTILFQTICMIRDLWFVPSYKEVIIILCGHDTQQEILISELPEKFLSPIFLCIIIHESQ